MIARVGLTRRIAVLCLLAAAVAVVAPGGTAPADAAPPWITIQSPHFTLVGDEVDQLPNKTGATRLGFALGRKLCG